MFWNKDKGGVGTKEGRTEQPKKATPRDLMAGQIDALEPAKEISFKLGEIYVKPFITVVRNTSGKKFTVYQDGKDQAGKPAGKRGKVWDVDHARDIANWLSEREGTLYKG